MSDLYEQYPECTDGIDDIEEHAAVIDELGSCPSCGQGKLQGCLRCGKPLEHGDNFCSDYCGASYAQDHGLAYIADIPEEREY